MKLKCLNRSVLKWIALVTMLIDHIGAVLGLETFVGWGLEWLYYLLRTIGRLSFPIFAFFIAEGYYYTKNKTRYVLLPLIFAIGIITVALSLMGMPISYGVYGVFLPVVFYAFNHSEKRYAKVVMWLVALLLMIAYWLLWFMLSDMTQISSYVSLFSVLSLPLLMCYNGQKGKGAPKYLFYIFYPIHILIIFLISLLF